MGRKKKVPDYEIARAIFEIEKGDISLRGKAKQLRIKPQSLYDRIKKWKKLTDKNIK